MQHVTAATATATAAILMLMFMFHVHAHAHAHAHGPRTMDHAQAHSAKKNELHGTYHTHHPFPNFKGPNTQH
jgi:hypothetical protein